MATCLAYIGLLTVALAYTLFEHAGVDLIGWNICLLTIGLSAALYWLLTPSNRRAPAMEPLLRWPVLLLPAYVGFQLLPLPLFLLWIVSPTRAQIVASLGEVMPAPAFAPLSVDPAATSAHLFRVLGCTLAFLLVREIASRSSGQWPWLPVLPLIVIAALEAGLGLLQAGSGAQIQGTYGSRNHLAGLLEMILPLAVAYGCALVARSLSREASWATTLQGCFVLCLAAITSAGVVSSLSKMGFVAGLCGLFLMGVLALGTTLKSWKMWALACLAALFLFLFLFLPSQELLRRFGSLSDDPWGEGRLPIGADTLRLIGSYPLFGCGLGGYESAFLRYQTAVVDKAFDFAHNDYLQLTAELGAIGLLVLAGLMLPIFVNAIKTAIRAPDSNTRYLSLGCVGGFAAIAIHSLADFNLYIPANALVLAWISGISCRTGVHSKRHSPAEDASSRVFVKRLGLSLAGLLIVYAPAWILFDIAFRSDPHVESFFCRFGICNTDAVLDAEKLQHSGNLSGVPPAPFLEALRRDPNSPDRWCDLGEAMLHAGHIEKAGYCFRNALSLGPENPPVLLRAATFYFSFHQNQRALEATSRILGQSAFYDDVIFDLYTEKHVPSDEILAHGLPRDPRPVQAYLRYLIGIGDVPGTTSVWNCVISHAYADDRMAREYVDFVLSTHRYDIAAQSWAQYLGPRRNDYLTSNWFFNGDFESEPSGAAFDWKIDNSSTAEAVRDATVAHSGTHSLRIQFKGQDNVNYGNIAQTAFVTPGSYRLQAYIQTEGITTDQGVAFRIFDPVTPTRLDIKTEQFIGSHPWSEIKQTFCVAPQTRLVEVQVIRQPSLKFDNKISGTAWIDSVKLSKVNEKCR